MRRSIRNSGKLFPVQILKILGLRKLRIYQNFNNSAGGIASTICNRAKREEKGPRKKKKNNKYSTSKYYRSDVPLERHYT
jgi:hypothetical protein